VLIVLFARGGLMGAALAVQRRFAKRP